MNLPLWGLLGSFLSAVGVWLGMRWWRRRVPREHRLDVSELLARLSDPKAITRVRAAGALGLRDAEDREAAVAGLMRALDDPEAEVRAVVVQSLGNLKDRRAGDGLALCLTDTATEVRGMALTALVEIGCLDSKREMAALLSDPEWTIRCWAMLELARTRDEVFLDDLLAAHDREIWRARRRLSEGVVRIVDERATAPLVIEMRDGKDPGIRFESLLAFEGLGYVRAEEKKVVENLVVAMHEDPSDGVRLHAAHALGGQIIVDDELFDQAREALKQVMKKDRDDNPLVRTAARLALKRLTSVSMRQDRSRQAAFNAALPEDGSPPVRVDMLGFDRLIDVLPDLRQPMRWRFADGLAALGNPKAVGPLLAVLTDDDWRLRAAVVRALGVLGAAETSGRIERLMVDDPADAVREAAAEALARFPRTLTAVG